MRLITGKRHIISGTILISIFSSEYDCVWIQIENEVEEVIDNGEQVANRRQAYLIKSNTYKRLK